MDVGLETKIADAGLVARIGDGMLVQERPGVAGRIVAVGPEERDFGAVAMGRRGEQGELLLTWSAPARPGVDDDGIALQRADPRVE